MAYLMRKVAPHPEMLMRTLNAILLASFLGLPTLAAAQSAPAPKKTEPKKTEKKCDPTGKECKSGDNCKPENCKPK